MKSISSDNATLPSGWATAKLPEIAIIVMGQSPPSSTYNTEGIGLPFFQGKAEFGPLYPRVEKYCSAPNKIAEEGATLLSVRAPVGPANIASQRSCIGRGLAAIHPLDEIPAKFLFYLFQSVEPKISKEGTGSTFKAINKHFVENIVLAVPPIQEQNRMVTKIEELFSEIDRGVESLTAAREQLKVYRQALLKHAFEGKLTEQWRKDNADKLESAEQLLARIKEEREKRYQEQIAEWEIAVKEWEVKGKKGKKPSRPKKNQDVAPFSKAEIAVLPKLPEGWGWVRLSILADNIQIGPFGSLLHRSDYIKGGIPLVNPSHIKDQGIYADIDLTIRLDKAASLQNYRMAKGDIVMGRRGEMGRCAVVTENEDGWLCGTGSLFIRLDSNMQSAFYCNVLSSQRIKDYLAEKSIGTTMQNLNEDILHDVPVPLCSGAEQSETLQMIAAQWSIIDQFEETIITSLQQAEAMRQSILKRAFSGQLVPQDPNDEPASLLLERIRAEREAAQQEVKKNEQKRGMKRIA